MATKKRNQLNLNPAPLSIDREQAKLATFEVREEWVVRVFNAKRGKSTTEYAYSFKAAMDCAASTFEPEHCEISIKLQEVARGYC